MTQRRGDITSKEMKTHIPSQVIALARGLDILQCFSAAHPQLGSTEIARLTNLPQPTVWRLCQTLLQYGFLLSVPGSPRFQLGTAALTLGVTATATFDAFEHVRPRMQHIANTYQTAVSIASREKLDMIYVERYAAEIMVGTNLRKGSRLSMHKCTLGWAILAAMQENARQNVIEELCTQFPDEAEQIRKQAISAVSQYEKNGYVVAKGLVHKNVIAAAIPICTDTGPQLAVNCSSDVSGMSARKLTTEITPALAEIARILQATLFTAGLKEGFSLR